MRRVSSGALLPMLGAAILGIVPPGNGRLLAQTSTAAIAGTVRDASREVIAAAAITVTHLETGLTRIAEADRNGDFTISAPPSRGV